MQLWIAVILLFAQISWSAAGEQSCTTENVKAVKWYALEPKGDDTLLTIYDAAVKTKLKEFKLGSSAFDYRIFFLKQSHAVVIRCQKDTGNDCGYYDFNLRVLTKKEQDDGVEEPPNYARIPWAFKLFESPDSIPSNDPPPNNPPRNNTNDEGEDERHEEETATTTPSTAGFKGLQISKILLIEDNIFFNKDYYFVRSSETIMKINAGTPEAELIDGCFNGDTSCGYDLRKNKVLKVKDDSKATLYYFNHMRFSYDSNSFYFDNVISEACYEVTKRFSQLLPLLAPDDRDIGNSKFIQDFDKTFAKGGQCPTKDAVEKVKKTLMEPGRSDSYYDDPQPDQTSKLGTEDQPCTGNDIYFTLFIVFASVSGLLVIVLIGVTAVAVVARKKLIAQGKLKAKKPFETEDGATEATTMTTVGDTSAYTTLQK